MIQPVGAKTLKEGLRIGAEVFHTTQLKFLSLKATALQLVLVRFAPNLKSNAEALEVIAEAACS